MKGELTEKNGFGFVLIKTGEKIYVGKKINEAYIFEIDDMLLLSEHLDLHFKMQKYSSDPLFVAVLLFLASGQAVITIPFLIPFPISIL